MSMCRCQYCAAEYGATAIDRHERKCLSNESLVADLRKVLDAGNGYAIVRREYRMLPNKPISEAHLMNVFGTWENAMHNLGLQPTFIGRGNSILNSPLTDAERYCCQRRSQAEHSYYPSR